jgi:AcrR family transcriptional regulator
VKETAERLMDLAEVHIRSAGYDGFSFRALAAEIGIKSASVHHHFPTKATKAAAVARRTDFLQRLRGCRERLPMMLSQLTGRPSKRRSIETATGLDQENEGDADCMEALSAELGKFGEDVEAGQA